MARRPWWARGDLAQMNDHERNELDAWRDARDEMEPDDGREIEIEDTQSTECEP